MHVFLRSEVEEANNSNKKNSAITRNGHRNGSVTVNMAEVENQRKVGSPYNANGHNANGVETTTTNDRMTRKQMKSDRQQLTNRDGQKNGILSTTATDCNLGGVPPGVAAEKTKPLLNGGDCGADKSENSLGVGGNEMDERKRNEVVLPKTTPKDSDTRSNSPSSYSYSGDDGINDVVWGHKPVEDVVRVMEKINLGTATSPVPAAETETPLPGNNNNKQHQQPPPIPEACLAQQTNEMMDSVGSAGSHYQKSNPAFKFLIPSAVAGCIIGKGGKIICKVQQETRTKIKLSQNHEFFPGTNDRVCLITGDEEDILVAMTDILQRIVGFYRHLDAHLAKQQQQNALRENGVGGTGESSSERAAPGHPVETDVEGATRSSAQDDSVLQGKNEENVETLYIKVLVPVSAAENLLKENNDALTLAAGNECIFHIMEDSSVPHERVCSLSGTVKGVLGLIQALFVVLRENELGGEYIHMTTAYKQCRSEIPAGGGAGAGGASAALRTGGSREQRSSTGSYYSNPSTKHQGQHPKVQYPCRGGGGGGEGGLPIDSGQDLGAIDRRGTALPSAACVQQGQQAAAHIGPLYSGFYPATSQEAGPPAYVLTPGGSNLMGTTSQEQLPYYYPYYGGGMGGIRGPSVVGMNGIVYPEGPPMTAAPQSVHIQISIPDLFVGVVLGKRGSNIMRIQKATGARIHISPRGKFVPGTTHRAVAITGTLQETTAAQYMISQSLNSAVGSGYNNSDVNVQQQQKMPQYTQQLLYSSQYDQAGMYPQQQRGHHFGVPPPPQV